MASTTVAPQTPVDGPDGGPSAGSLTELAALEAARTEKRQLLARAAEAARAGKRALPAGCTGDAVTRGDDARRAAVTRDSLRSSVA